MQLKSVSYNIVQSEEGIMHGHILRPGTKGPTERQRAVLIDLDLELVNPDDMLSSEITAIISAEFRKRKDYGQVMVERKWKERERLIQQLGLKPGTRVARTIYTRSGQGKKSEKGEMVDVVVEITPEWYVRFGGPKNPIHPSLIIRVLKEP